MMRKRWRAMKRACILLEAIEPRVLLASLANVLVNDPSLDTTTQDTQSETSNLVFGSTVLVTYNDSGSNAGSPNQFTGWSRPFRMSKQENSSIVSVWSWGASIRRPFGPWRR